MDFSRCDFAHFLRRGAEGGEDFFFLEVVEGEMFPFKSSRLYGKEVLLIEHATCVTPQHSLHWSFLPSIRR